MLTRANCLAATMALAFTAFTVATPAFAESHVITVAGDLQSELGCPGDWQPACDNSELAPTGAGRFAATFSLPAGAYQFKITVNGSWDENYGADGVRDGANIPLVLLAPASLLFSYDDATHRVSIAPTSLPGPVSPADAALARDSLRQPLTREQFYFVMTDRFANGDPANDAGGLSGGRLQTGFDPTHKGFYHGGDLRGLIDKLDYIEGLGSTSIWLTPSFKNKPVQGGPGQESAGYHGYWITDFTQIDPHLGTNAELKELIDKAHARGMKVFFDIITNHTADVIDYTEKQYSYIPKATEPYRTADGTPFDDRDYVNQPFPPMDPAVSFPYTPVFNTPADATAKTPSWLNDPLLYHNRGDSTFAGESAFYGDFIGLDDLFTERPEVLQGMQDIYKAWVDFGVDGFRIDTAKHVNTEFWQQFSPAMLQRAAANGNSDFFMFGEVFDADPKFQSIYSTTAKLPATLDFGFQQNAAAVANGGATTYLSKLFVDDDYYTDHDSNAYDLPTFLGNHDMGRIGRFVGGSQQRDVFAHALMYTLRGQPVVYYGDEQGFVGDGGDQDARQSLFPSQVASYNDDPVIGGVPGSMARYDTSSPMYRTIKALADLRKAHPALADGAQTVRYASDAAGILAVSRVGSDGVEYLVVANNATSSKTASFATFTPSTAFTAVYGAKGGFSSTKAAQVTATVPPLTVQVFRARRAVPASGAAPAVAFASPSAGGVLADRAEIRASVPANTPVQVSFAYRPVGATQWQFLGTDDNAPFRVFHDVSGFAKGTLLEYRTVLKDNAGHLSAASTYGVVGDAPKPVGGGVGDVTQPAAVSVPGTINSEMGCPNDWMPDCPQAQLSLDANDKIWKGTFVLPAGTYSYKVALNGTWDENYGAGGVQNGPNIDLTSDGTTPITFFYDHRTHFVTSSAQGPIVVSPGSFQSEMGCATDWDPACMRSWLQDPDGDGTFTLSTTQIPPGTYEAKVAINRSWDVNYGQNGVPNGANIPFTVPNAAGVITTFSYDGATHVLTITSSTPGAKPDLSVTAAYWLDASTIAYPANRLPAGADPSWFRFRLHWGTLAVDAYGLGGSSAALSVVSGAPEGYLALRLDQKTAENRDAVLAAPMAAIGVYDDAGRLLDATSVRRP